MLTLETFLPDEAATLRLGGALAPCLEPGLSIHLRGDLGAGKTTLARGVLGGLGHAGPVKSPTYALVEVYALSRLDLHHFDFYRFHDPSEWIDAGFRESFGGTTVTLVEWPERAGGLLPPRDVDITLTPSAEGRTASFTACSPRGETLLDCLAARVPPSTG
jgi:tRNA threonylcarbamoyladenosine biosynthesis protein TsaE